MWQANFDSSSSSSDTVQGSVSLPHYRTLIVSIPKTLRKCGHVTRVNSYLINYPGEACTFEWCICSEVYVGSKTLRNR